MGESAEKIFCFIQTYIVCIRRWFLASPQRKIYIRKQFEIPYSKHHDGVSRYFFFLSFGSYNFVLRATQASETRTSVRSRKMKKKKNGNRWEDLCKMSNARRYVKSKALRETVWNETGERFRSRHKLFALHSTHRFRKRFSDLWVTASVQLFSFFFVAFFVLLLGLLVCGVAFGPGQFTVTYLKRCWINVISWVDGKWLIAHTWFSSTISMIRSSVSHYQTSERSSRFSRPRLRSVYNESRNSHMCSEITFLCADFLFFDKKLRFMSVVFYIVAIFFAPI